MILDLSKKRRSIRKYKNKEVKNEIIKEIAINGMNYPSRMNLQPLKFVMITDKSICDETYKCILWGSKNSDFKKFCSKDFAPDKYIAICVDKSIMSAGYEYELGAASELILLSAVEYNLGSLWVKSFDRLKLKKILNIEDDNIIIDSLICIGYSDQENKTIDYDENISVVIDDNLNIIVPKRKEEEVIFENEFRK